jgi:hypothetical protein
LPAVVEKPEEVVEEPEEVVEKPEEVVEEPKTNPINIPKPTNVGPTPAPKPVSTPTPRPVSTPSPAGTNTMSTSAYTDPKLDFTPSFVKGSQISLVGAPTFSNAYISPEQTKVDNDMNYFSAGGYAEGSQVSLDPQFARGRAKFLQSLLSPMARPQVGPVGFERHSEGHEVGEHRPEFYSEGGLGSIENRYVTGNGDGTSDSIPAMLANGEFVIPADVVASLGNGSNESGASVLDQFMKVIREHKRDAHADHLPPDSKGPLAYLQEAQKKVA